MFSVDFIRFLSYNVAIKQKEKLHELQTTLF